MEGRLEIRQEVALAPLTTFGVGGAARFFVEATTEVEIREALVWAKERGVDVFVLGGGSNLLVSDEGFTGLVLKIGLKGVQELGEGFFEVAAGEVWDDFVQRAVDGGFAGVECLAGIPGSVGGTPVQNVGAYGQEVAETILAVRVFDRSRGEFVGLRAEECTFRYRESRFNSDEPGRFIVTSVGFQLRPGGEANLKYADLQKKFGVAPTSSEAARAGESGPGATVLVDAKSPTLVEVAAAVREIRRSKGMLIVEGDPDSRSAGSFFKNPVVSEEMLKSVEAAAGVEVPHWPAGDGKVKLAAAWLLEKSGFVKGYAEGTVGISSRHTLALINRGGATAEDVERLQWKIAAMVWEKFGVELVREPVLVG